MSKNFLNNIEKTRLEELNKKEYVEDSHKTIANEVDTNQTLDDILDNDDPFSDIPKKSPVTAASIGGTDPFSDWKKTETKKPKPAKPRPAPAKKKSDPGIGFSNSNAFDGFGQNDISSSKPKPKPKPAKKSDSDYTGFAPLAINPVKKSTPPKSTFSTSSNIGFSSSKPAASTNNMFTGM